MAASEISRVKNSLGFSPVISNCSIRLSTVTGIPASNKATVASASGWRQNSASISLTALISRLMRDFQSIAIRFSFWSVAVDHERQGVAVALARHTMPDSLFGCHARFGEVR